MRPQRGLKTNKIVLSPGGLKAILSLVFLLSAFYGSFGAAQRESVNNLRLWHSPDNTRIVFDVSATLQHKAFQLDSPPRLVIDLNQADLNVQLPEIDPNNQHIKAIRYGRPKPGVLRVVFELRSAVKFTSFVLNPNELYGHRLVVDISDRLGEEERISDNITEKGKPSVEDTEIVAEEPNQSTALSTQSTQISLEPSPKKYIVAIDAGHGGDDPGAIGFRGTREKQLTLSIAKKLKQKIDDHPNMDAVMVRTGDYYIQLTERRQKARYQDADIFISIHADAFTKKSANGMSVFALSQRGATSAMAKTLAEKENASDLIGGVSLADKDDVLAKVLVDLSMTNTISESVNLGGRVLEELGKLGRLHSKRVEQASFVVLKSPDMPSILVETGFITNPGDEKRLRSSSFQNKLANAIYTAVSDYFDQTPYASRSRYESPSIDEQAASNNPTRYSRYKVRRGDTLSTIAKKFGISLKELKRLNNIKHNTAMLGVRLKVPANQGTTTKSNVSTSSFFNHTVKNGESLSKISAQYNVTIRSIKRVNNLSRDTLYKGQVLKIPGTSSFSATKIKIHTVKRGDTLSEIAQSYRSSVSAIKKLNKLRSNTVMLGQKLKVPVSAP